MSTESAAIIDDTDPRIQYSSGWHMDGGPNEYNRTVHATSTAGASFTFSFTGTSVKVLGTLTQEGFNGSFPNTTYSLDGTSPIPYAGKPSPRVQYQQIFYQSPADLPNTKHTLVGTCADQGSLVWIDFFVVTSPPSPTTSGASSQTESTVIITTTATYTEYASSSSSSAFPVGAVVGGVIGAMILVLIGLFLFLWHRRRPRAVTSTEMQATMSTTSTTHLVPQPPPTLQYPTFAPSVSSVYSTVSPTETSPMASLNTANAPSFPSPSATTQFPRKGRPMYSMGTFGAPSSSSRHSTIGDTESEEHPPAYH
ncbi:hypothetical protein PC9H_011537 [Pleurotus ostreatus]|uniref:Uncharacterized protein n=1 Tax=Pleurotus ostreatus TaxID=5322 RepID=A0A8H7DN92_PLEOS|nr:uncharacterized protein PC9H_011537 [Pleurotus ostreatus]KAF7421018.1 hypothetical protein PC9H_011537 [Pleurotus ostreatus]